MFCLAVHLRMAIGSVRHLKGDPFGQKSSFSNPSSFAAAAGGDHSACRQTKRDGVMRAASQPEAYE